MATKKIFIDYKGQPTIKILAIDKIPFDGPVDYPLGGWESNIDALTRITLEDGDYDVDYIGKHSMVYMIQVRKVHYK